MAGEPLEVTLTVRVKPWTAPNYATPVREPGGDGDRVEGIHVSKLTPDTLDVLADAWLGELYEKAGKPNPWTRVREGG